MLSTVRVRPFQAALFGFCGAAASGGRGFQACAMLSTVRVRSFQAVLFGSCGAAASGGRGFKACVMLSRVWVRGSFRRRRWRS